jgi:hypothetical protein
MDEWQLQGRLQDAAAQQLRVEQLLEDQEQRLKGEVQRRATTAMSTAQAGTPLTTGGGGSGGGTGSSIPPPPLQTVAMRSSAGSGAAGSTPGTPQGRGSALTAATPKGGVAGAAAGRAALASGPPPPGADASPLEQIPATRPLLSIDAVVDNSELLEPCYSHLKHLLSNIWPPREAHTPGMLLIQRHAAAGCARAAAPEMIGDGGVLEAPRQQNTVLRLQSVTSAAASLQLPRGEHLLRVVCSNLLLHAVGFACASDFEILDDSAGGLPTQPSPAAPGLVLAGTGQGQQQPAQSHQLLQCGVVQQDGTHDIIRAGARLLLFRSLLSATEACSVSVSLRCSSAALAAAVRLVAVDNDTGQETAGPLNCIEGLRVRRFAFLHGLCCDHAPDKSLTLRPSAYERAPSTSFNPATSFKPRSCSWSLEAATARAELCWSRLHKRCVTSHPAPGPSQPRTRWECGRRRPRRPLSAPRRPQAALRLPPAHQQAAWPLVAASRLRL